MLRAALTVACALAIIGGAWLAGHIGGGRPALRDGVWVATVDGDGQLGGALRVFEAYSGEELLRTGQGRWGVEGFSASGRFLLATLYRRTNGPQLAEEYLFDLREHRMTALGVWARGGAWAPDGTRFTLDDGQRVGVFDTSGQQIAVVSRDYPPDPQLGQRRYNPPTATHVWPDRSLLVARLRPLRVR